jgi:hypothetical protein
MQGPHQVAKKLIKTTFPFKSDNLVGFPSIVMEKFGAFHQS